MGEHALLSASSAERWINCPGSVALCKNLPDVESEFAKEGTVAHTLASEALLSGEDAVYFRGMLSAGKPAFPSDITMFDEVQKYVDQIRDYVGAGTLLVEKRVDYSDYIGVPDSFGTSDAIIISEDGAELMVVDLKYGKGITVDADENPQLMLYALGAINEFSALGDFKRVRLVISQPRLNHLSEWSCSIEELMKFAEKAKDAAQLAVALLETQQFDGDELYFNPGESQCRWCKGKAKCPALANKVMQEIESGFDAVTDEIPVSTIIDDLADKMKAVPLIEDWCRAIRAKVESELLQGNPVDGFKLVRGKAGNRKWVDEKQVEETLKAMRLKQEEMYDFSLISPPVAEKLLKDTPRRWAKVEELITRSEGKISVASVDDKRPALDVSNVEAGFEVIENDN